MMGLGSHGIGLTGAAVLLDDIVAHPAIRVVDFGYTLSSAMLGEQPELLKTVSCAASVGRRTLQRRWH